MTDPTVRCDWCGRERNCLLHMRAEHPPTAAKQWLRKMCVELEHDPKCCAGCSKLTKPCNFTYRAGVRL